MQIATATLFLIAAMGAVASPVEPNANGMDARDGIYARITYSGTCTRSDNTCKYKNQNNGNTFIKCPTAANKKCTNDGKACSYDSVSKAVTCN